jgi:hypothetical protein
MVWYLVNHKDSCISAVYGGLIFNFNILSQYYPYMLCTVPVLLLDKNGQV